MNQKRGISYFLLYLLILINWHNASFHSHQEEIPEITHHSDHHHSDHHHHHSSLAFWDWLQQMLGDFEHTDLGDKHLELLLQSSHQLSLSQTTSVVFQPFGLTLDYALFFDSGLIQNNKIPPEVLSFSDPPFPDAITNRGPPQFS